MKTLNKITAVLFAVALLVMSTLTAAASTTTQTDSIELRTQSALLIDRSGSMEDQEAVKAILAQIDQSAFDAVVYFDHRLSTVDGFAGGGNSSICEAIHKAAEGGFEHITIVTDGEQWPGNFSSLGIYTDLDLTIHLVEEDEASSEFINQLKSRLVNSSLKVVKPDGQEEIVLDEYQPPIYEVQIEVPVIPEVSESDDSEPQPQPPKPSESEDDHKVVIVDEEGKCHWWVALIVAVLVAALFDFIHELITRGREETGGDPEQQQPQPRPMPVKAVVQIAQGARVVADFSGSMAAQQSETAKACMDAQRGSETVLCFGDSVSEHTVDELEGIQAAGQTAGWEAMEQAASKGWDEIVLVSDLGFNGKAFHESVFSKKFKKVTVVTPSSYHVPTLKDLQKIADEVEVLPLQ